MVITALKKPFIILLIYYPPPVTARRTPRSAVPPECPLRTRCQRADYLNRESPSRHSGNDGHRPRCIRAGVYPHLPCSDDIIFADGSDGDCIGIENHHGRRIVRRLPYVCGSAPRYGSKAALRRQPPPPAVSTPMQGWILPRSGWAAPGRSRKESRSAPM